VAQGDAKYNYDINGNALPQGAGIARKFVDKSFEMYLQDSWKVTRGLTVSGGLRVSLNPALNEANGDSDDHQYSAVRLVQSARRAGRPGLTAIEGDADFVLTFRGKPNGRSASIRSQHDSRRASASRFTPQSNSGFPRQACSAAPARRRFAPAPAFTMMYSGRA